MQRRGALLWISIVAAAVVAFIFSLAIFPSAKSQPRELPVALVNLDQGARLPGQSSLNLGDRVVEALRTVAQKQTDFPVSWVSVHTWTEAKRGMDQQKYYGALVIPSDFTMKQLSLRSPRPTPPTLDLYVNQGMNASASAVVTQFLNGVADQIANNTRNQLLAWYQGKHLTLTVSQAAALATPLTKQVITVHPVGAHSANGNAPVLFFQPLWIATLVTALLSFFSLRTWKREGPVRQLTGRVGIVAIGALASVVIGFELTWLAQHMLGFDIPDFYSTAGLLAISSFSFFLMISAVLLWVGLPGIALFVLLLFFGAPLLSLAPEMMPAFYRHWIYSWLPMRFLVSGLRTLFFFDQKLSWDLVSVLVWIGVVSLVVVLASAFKPQRPDPSSPPSA